MKESQQQKEFGKFSFHTISCVEMIRVHNIYTVCTKSSVIYLLLPYKQQQQQQATILYPYNLLTDDVILFMSLSLSRDL